MSNASSSSFRGLTLIALAAMVLPASAYANAIFNVGATSLPGGQLITFRTGQTSMTVEGFAGNNDAMPVQFSSTQELMVHSGTSNSSDIKTPAGTNITNITIMSPGNIFTGLDLDVSHPVDPNVIVVVTMSDGTTFPVMPSGWATSTQNFLQITTIGGELISKVTIDSTGFVSLRKELVAGIAPAPPPIPEPSSMLLLGSGVLLLAQGLRRKLM